MRYFYGMRLRGFSLGCQPMKGLVDHYEDPLGRYHEILVYSRPLTDAEVNNYEFDYMGEDDL